MMRDPAETKPDREAKPARIGLEDLTKDFPDGHGSQRATNGGP